MNRQPVAAGRFYPADKKGIEIFLSGTGPISKSKKDALAIVSPHAGYIYSGAIAVQTISGIRIADTVVIIGPNHAAIGSPFAVYGSGKWHTPLGDIAVDEKMSCAICRACGLIMDDKTAHCREHSIEVQLPILQYFRRDFKIVPIILQGGSLGQCRQIAEAIVNAKEKTGTDILIIASSDMTHYESYDTAARKDGIAIEAMLKLDENLLYESVCRYDISMCGCPGVAVALSAAKKMGANLARLIRYATSADATGDYDSVVGYAGVVVEKVSV
ncbi:MAG: AmmeMemoRadiSam system protein B [Candidatus Omnitrophica bacterium]|nr:AmmeMemoRadiSam system protein B [Candidatus Omnitrophota bacterium]